MKSSKKNTLFLIHFFLLACIFISCKPEIKPNQDLLTDSQIFCNPLNLNYRFMVDTPSRREAADPTVVFYKNDYYLFASKSGGYWHSPDLLKWNFVPITDEVLPIEDYAPTVVEMNDTLYFMASSRQQKSIYKSADPKNGKWMIAKQKFPIAVWDPCLFVDDDQKLYLYWGCSNKNPLYVIELDPADFDTIGSRKEILSGNPAEHGWEKRGDNNELDEAPWIEGAWMNKINGKYYLQYSAPGTEFKGYGDGMYLSDKPTGPFTYQQHNPVSFKNSGFTFGAGHGSTFTDRYENLWHICTSTISVKHIFERRLCLFPAYVDDAGIFYVETALGDYPMEMPDRKINTSDSIFKPWNLLSYKKPVTASSFVIGQDTIMASDENSRTYWSASSGKEGEWLEMDLGAICDVNAVQVNFAEHESSFLGRKNKNNCYRYEIQFSDDKKYWKNMDANTENCEDSPHDLVALTVPVHARYIKIMNLYTPSGNFAISDLRVFGTQKRTLVQEIKNFNVHRNSKDPRCFSFSWKKDTAATGYIIRYGNNISTLYSHVIIMDSTGITLNNFNLGSPYSFTIQGFNESGKGPSCRPVLLAN